MSKQASLFDEVGQDSGDTVKPVKAPFPYFGGKSRAASLIWRAFGDAKNYVEPFCGSLGALLAREGEPIKVATLNDANGLLVNAWRAIRDYPAEVARECEQPVSELDTLAWQVRLVESEASLIERLVSDPDWCDVRLAAAWVRGTCEWIGTGYCSGHGRWWRDDDGVVREHPRGARPGVSKQLPHLGDDGRGVHRPGVAKQLPHLRNDGCGVHRPGSSPGRDDLSDWFTRIALHLRHARLVCGDWRRVLSPSVTTGQLTSRSNGGVCAIFLDPPYETSADVYRAGAASVGVYRDVVEWCREHTASTMRIVLAGYRGECGEELVQHGWRVVPWDNRSGFLGGGINKENAKREILFLSPACCEVSSA